MSVETILIHAVQLLQSAPEFQTSCDKVALSVLINFQSWLQIKHYKIMPLFSKSSCQLIIIKQDCKLIDKTSPR